MAPSQDDLTQWIQHGTARSEWLMSWLIILLAGIFEVLWAVGLKLNTGFKCPITLALTVVSILVSLVLLAVAMRELPLGTAYAIWTGIGAVGAFVVGITFFNEPVTATRILSITMLVAGLIGLKLTSPSHSPNHEATTNIASVLEMAKQEQID